MQISWKQALNPWGLIRTLRERVAYLEGRLDEVAERAEDAEARAFHRASKYYFDRLHFEEQRNAEMIARMSDLASMAPPPFLRQQQQGHMETRFGTIGTGQLKP